MQTLKDLSKAGRTIIQTIHQPNSDIFNIFDKLILLAQGNIIYFNDADKAVNYFNKIIANPRDGTTFSCPDLSNPADYFMSIMSIESIEKKDYEEGDDDNISQS